MRSRKLLLTLVIVLAVVAIAAAVTYHVIRRPARALYLLPDGNVLAYVSFTPFRFMNMDTHPITSDPDYQEFRGETGFDVQHDLDNIAISANAIGGSTPDIAAVISGTFNPERISGYVRKQPNVETENYGGKTIYFAPEQDHTVRFCILDTRMVAVTFGSSADTIHGIIEKFTGSGSTPQLLKDYYDDVPFASAAWAIVRAPQFASPPPGPGGVSLDFLKNSVTVLSVRYTGSVRFRAEFISNSQGAAQKVFTALNTIVAVGRMEAQSEPNPDRDVAEVMNSLEVKQSGNRVVLSVVVPQELIKKASQKQRR
jgi:hypothetical protein